MRRDKARLAASRRNAGEEYGGPLPGSGKGQGNGPKSALGGSRFAGAAFTSQPGRFKSDYLHLKPGPATVGAAADPKITTRDWTLMMTGSFYIAIFRCENQRAGLVPTGIWDQANERSPLR